MNQNSDYISQLNLEFPPSVKSESSNDLASFTDANFFDFDQFSEDTLKLNYQEQFQEQLETIETPSTSIHRLNNSTLDGFNYLEKFVEANTPAFPQDVQVEMTSPIPQQHLQEMANVSKPSIVSPSSALPESSSDKKKRNTAASARFRIKKKLKEQEMERALKELKDRVSQYNVRIQQLEMENSCLKSLIVQKNEQRSNALLRSIKEKSLNSD